MAKKNMTKNPSCRFYIVRHGQSEGNVLKILQGHADYTLTAQGKSEATQFAKELKLIHFDAIFSSDLLRAHQTAQILASEHVLAVKTNQLLREQNFGPYNGQPIEKFQTELQSLLKSHQKLTDEERFKHKVHDDIETDETMVSRFITFLRETALAYPGKTVLVVSHGAMMRTLLIHLGFGTYANLTVHSVQNLGHFILDSDGIDFFIRETHGIKKF